MIFNSKLLKEKEIKKPIHQFIPGQAFVWKSFSHDEVGICIFVGRDEGGRNSYICLNNMKIYSNYEHDTKYTVINIEAIDVKYVNAGEGEV